MVPLHIVSALIQEPLFFRSDVEKTVMERAHTHEQDIFLEYSAVVFGRRRNASLSKLRGTVTLFPFQKSLQNVFAFHKPIFNFSKIVTIWVLEIKYRKFFRFGENFERFFKASGLLSLHVPFHLDEPLRRRYQWNWKTKQFMPRKILGLGPTLIVDMTSNIVMEYPNCQVTADLESVQANIKHSTFWNCQTSYLDR